MVNPLSLKDLLIIRIRMVKSFYHIIGQLPPSVLIHNPLIVHGPWSVAEPLKTNPHIAKLPDKNAAAPLLIQHRRNL